MAFACSCSTHLNGQLDTAPNRVLRRGKSALLQSAALELTLEHVHVDPAIIDVMRHDRLGAGLAARVPVVVEHDRAALGRPHDDAHMVAAPGRDDGVFVVAPEGSGSSFGRL